ncbi:hypothetical protein F2Q69_00014760 [Brassica cretica]|uniref:Pectinesterase inhibitor domain-containing protein n=2 Tax=Brassica cretica TaxID=69181 RepID=A0ABQ7DUH2_BRACR|nr:hypothetical protein F2Q69_00014760 [Brassica cretica]KAF3581688.1 hypothetical protein DY000_02032292 [Brassica cretica]
MASSTSSSLPNHKFMILNLFHLHTLVFANSSNSKFSKFSRHPKSKSSSSRRTKYSNDGFLNSVQHSLDQALLAHSLAFRLTLSHTSQTLMLDPVNDCLELLDDTLDMLSRIVVNLKVTPMMMTIRG